MKKILPFALLLLLFLPFISCFDDKENEIETLVTYNDLPAIAQKFLSDYFGGKDNVSKIEKDSEENVIFYEVDLKDGFEIVFNEAGYWQEIDAPYGSVIPTSILPEPIQQTLSERFHGYGVIEINTTGENYHLVLSDNQGGASLDLTFNQSGEIISTGEMD